MIANASFHRNLILLAKAIAWTIVCAATVSMAHARSNIRAAFFEVFPSAVGSRLDTLPSKPGHCGVCHFDFNGGGTRNPWGVSVENALPGFPNTSIGRSNAVYSVRNVDSDADGYSTLIEVTSSSFSNIPTFPGLKASNLSSVRNVTLSEIQNYLTPTNIVDTTPPAVTVTAPNGGQTWTANRTNNITWTATDASGVASVSIYFSTNNGASFQPVALGLANSGTHAWVPANRPTTTGRIRVVATDNASNTGQDQSDAAFAVVSPPGGRVPTTLRDFDLPGTQPFEGGPALEAPETCAACHGNYNPSVEPYFTWQGSMMAHAGRDPLFLANMAIANQDAPDSGDLCLRCHNTRGWLEGRSVPTDGSRMTSADFSGVSCDQCHRMVDPIYEPNVSPFADVAILSALSFPGTEFGNGMAVIDPTGTRRGPFTNTASPHSIAVSPFHQEAAFCGTCHDVSNPAFERDPNGNYVPNAFNSPATNFSAHSMLPVERTYSEWLYSAYNSSNGVHAPAFAGNKPGGNVSTCQDCHMRDVSGKGCDPAQYPQVPVRPDLPLHDMTGGSIWLMGLMTNLFPNDVNAAAIEAGIRRATYLLTNAASLAVADYNGQLRVTVTNQTGHKLPTGYPEGRRVWLNVKFFDATGNVLAESGAYNPNTGVLTHDPQLKIYEVHPGLETNLANDLGLPPGPSFHFVLNNRVYSDNRIPPRGFTNANYALFGGTPVAYSYADGQYWDHTLYDKPAGTARAEVRLYYQSTSKEFVEFLRDENVTNSKGQEMFDLWNNNGKCPPTLMAETAWLPLFAYNGIEFDDQHRLHIQITSRPGTSYTIEFADTLSPPTFQEFQTNGTITATSTETTFTDDFTANSSGGPSVTGARFYRFRYSGIE